MQHTDKYKFNIIETSGTFSPDALNANAQAVETELAALAATEANHKAALEATAANKAALEQALAAQKSALQTAIGSVGKTARIVTGAYVGTGNCGQSYPTSITFDFKPYLVLVGKQGSSTPLLFFRPHNYALNTAITSSWGEKSVSWWLANVIGQHNEKDATYYYVAIGADE